MQLGCNVNTTPTRLADRGRKRTAKRVQANWWWKARSGGEDDNNYLLWVEVEVRREKLFSHSRNAWPSVTEITCLLQRRNNRPQQRLYVPKWDEGVGDVVVNSHPSQAWLTKCAVLHLPPNTRVHVCMCCVCVCEADAAFIKPCVSGLNPSGLLPSSLIVLSIHPDGLWHLFSY